MLSDTVYLKAPGVSKTTNRALKIKEGSKNQGVLRGQSPLTTRHNNILVLFINIYWASCQKLKR